MFGRLAGYEGVNDAERLCRDPAMRWVVGDRAITGFAASASQMGRFETKWLCRVENLAALVDLPGQWIDQVHRRRHHPLFVFNQFGDVERCVLRPGNVHSADGWRALLEPVIARYRDSVKRLYFRGDAAFGNPEMYE